MREASKFEDLAPETLKCFLQNLSYTQLKAKQLKGYWDQINCSPPIIKPLEQNMTQTCQNLLTNMDKSPDSSSSIDNVITRFCTGNATWYWNEFENQTSCCISTKNPSQDFSKSWITKEIIRYTLFIGSISSLLFLTTAIFLFSYFKSIRCHRITILKHFMAALAIKSCVLILISDPTPFSEKYYYRDVDWICKLVVLIQLYSYLTSINWMLIQGHFLNSKLSTDIFQQNSKLKFYYVFGWGAPMILILVWYVGMETHYNYPCWKYYSKSKIIWIIVGPMLIALLLNILFLINIIRILVRKAKVNTSNSPEMHHFRRASKATAVLFPLLGLNNLVFFFNPGGSWVFYYMMTNAILQPLQGIAVSVIYCFVCQDVRDCVRREYRKFLIGHHFSVNHSFPCYTASKNNSRSKHGTLTSQHVQVNCNDECDFV